ncbi:MAG: hypothetical protein R3F05_19825 [Planctomycetota bacterium]
MHTSTSLLDLHRRTHHSLKGVLGHARTVPPEVIHRTLDAIGPGTIAEKLQHVNGAERYWIGVVKGEMLVDEDEADAASVDALEAFRQRVAARTRSWLEDVGRRPGHAGSLRPVRRSRSDLRACLRRAAHADARVPPHRAGHRDAPGGAFGHPVPPGLTS